MSTVKLIVIVIALVVIASMVLKAFIQAKTQDTVTKLSDNRVSRTQIGAEKQTNITSVKSGDSVTKKALSVKQDIERNPYKADIARARGDAVATAGEAIGNSTAVAAVGKGLGSGLDKIGQGTGKAIEITGTGGGSILGDIVESKPLRLSSIEFDDKEL